MSIDTIAIEWSESCISIFEKHWKTESSMAILNRPSFFGYINGWCKPELDWKSLTQLGTPQGRRWLEVQRGTPQTVRIRKGNLSKTSTPILRENPKIRSKKAMSTSTTQLLHSYIIQWISSPKATKHNYVKLILEIQVLGSSENISYVVEHPKKKCPTRNQPAQKTSPFHPSQGTFTFTAKLCSAKPFLPPISMKSCIASEAACGGRCYVCMDFSPATKKGTWDWWVKDIPSGRELSPYPHPRLFFAFPKVGYVFFHGGVSRVSG